MTDRRAAPAAFGSIVHVNDKGGCFGGTEEYLAVITAELSRRGVTSGLVCGAITGEVPRSFDAVHVVRGLASRRPGPPTAPELVRVVGDLQPDVVLVHNVFDPAVVSSLAARTGRGPLVWYVHDHYLTCLSELRWRRDRQGGCRERLGTGCLEAIEEGRCVLRHPERRFDAEELERRRSLFTSLCEVDAVVVVSDYMRSVLLEAGPQLEGRVHLLPRPVRDLDTTPSLARHDTGDATCIVFAGRITAEKGLAVLLEALGQLHDVGPVELRIAGLVEDEVYWSHCQHVQREAVARNPSLAVTYLGHLDYQGTSALFQRSDIVAVPSQWPEPLGAVAIEAMAAGAAVVASDIGGLSTYQTHGRTGLLVDPSDVRGWTQALEGLISRPRLARKLAAQGRRAVRGATTVHHLRAFDELIEDARRIGTGTAGAST